jgi:hypothetical protein
LCWSSQSPYGELHGELHRGDVQQRCGERRVLTSIEELQAAINRFIAETNDKPKPFVWTKYDDAILGAVQHRRQALEAIH